MRYLQAMKAGSFSVTALLPAAPKDVYGAWMSGKEHSAMTGAPAKVTAKEGGKFSAWDGYIKGKTLKLKPDSKIVQAWRTTDFPPDAPDSRLEIELEAKGRGTRITLTHSKTPLDQAGGYKKGWIDFYFKPMKAYFAQRR
jgi:activator of HSP90 ATPase